MLQQKWKLFFEATLRSLCDLYQPVVQLWHNVSKTKKSLINENQSTVLAVIESLLDSCAAVLLKEVLPGPFR